MINIAHLAFDEKFIDNAADFFEEAFPSQNKFYIFSRKPWSHLKDRKLYTFCNNIYFLKFIFGNGLAKYDVVVIHGLASIFLPLLMIRKKRYIWIGWGYDYYQRGFPNELNEEFLYLNRTKHLLSKMKVVSDSKVDKKSITQFLKRIKCFFLDSKIFYLLSVRNVKVFSPVLPEEYSLVKTSLGLGGHTVYKPWNYASIEKHLLKGRLEANSLGIDILLGNSATATNNHLDILLYLSKISLGGRKIYIPLSYGDFDYACEIQSFIKNNKVLSESCVVLRDFISIEEYYNIVSRCGFIIMNHLRQQAMGNIVSLMYAGAKVFLREESVLYSHLKNQGAIISSVQELEGNEKLLDSPLSEVDIIKNRTILLNTWSHDIIVARTKELVSSALISST